MRLRPWAAFIFLFFSFLLASCGGGGGSSAGGGANTTPPPPPTPPQLKITTSSLPPVLAGQPYSFQLEGSGGVGALTWSSTSQLPAGLSLSSSGLITGELASPNNYILFIKLQDSGSPAQSVSTTFSILVPTPITIVAATPMAPNRFVSFDFPPVVTGGTPPYTMAISAGALPPGVTLLNNHISGTPTQAGVFSYTLQVTDSGPDPIQQTASVATSMTVASSLQITSMNLPVGVQNRPYSFTLTAVNGTDPLQWSVNGLPAGLTLDSATGIISGTPTNATVNSVILSVTVTDSSSPPAQSTTSLFLNIAGVLQFTSTNLGNAIAGQFAFFNIPFSGGLRPVSATLVSGSLPSGWALDSSIDSISGDSSQLGTYTFTVQLQDSASPPQTAQGSLTLNIVPKPPVITTTTLPRAVINASYNASLAATQGTPPYDWSIQNGALPAGLTLDSTGLIHGTPTTLGASTFTLLLTDSGSPAQTATQSFSLTVNASFLGRNDTIQTATPLSNGAFMATISPYNDPSASGPDTDYYRLSASPGATVFIGIHAQQLSPPSPLDSVIEIVDSNGTRLSICKDPAQAFLQPPAVLDPNPNDFNDSCINDDESPNTLDSSLQLQVPGSATSPLTFYVHVLDWNGSARPDMVYQIQVSGAN